MKVIIYGKPKEIAELINAIKPQTATPCTNPNGNLIDKVFNAAVKETENEVLNGGILPTDDEMDVLIDNDYVTEANFSNPAPIYGVSGLYSPKPELTRTDDAVGMTFSINRNTGEIASDFNDVFPWNKTEIVFDDENNKFVSFPEMYFRVGTDENHRLTDIAVSEHPAAEGTWYRVAPFMYGCYGGSIERRGLSSVRFIPPHRFNILVVHRICHKERAIDYDRAYI